MCGSDHRDRQFHFSIVDLGTAGDCKLSVLEGPFVLY